MPTLFNLIGGGGCPTRVLRNSSTGASCCTDCKTSNGLFHTINCNETNTCSNGCSNLRGGGSNFCCDECQRTSNNSHTLECVNRNNLCTNECGRYKVNSTKCCDGCTKHGIQSNHTEACNNRFLNVPQKETANKSTRKDDNYFNTSLSLNVLGSDGTRKEHELVEFKNAPISVVSHARDAINSHFGSKLYTLEGGSVENQTKQESNLMFDDIKNMLNDFGLEPYISQFNDINTMNSEGQYGGSWFDSTNDENATYSIVLQ